ncbi:unnamed protein product [Nesidiocoris tenuis]|uniref:Uncharacterized protein n=1 Tax=Nesidiocoris tenuis TaxID=355587 RepID=A0A6H5GI73_9HEMI|nr:unnamed protein product [Nesidiocoris tenuis]
MTFLTKPIFRTSQNQFRPFHGVGSQLPSRNFSRRVFSLHPEQEGFLKKSFPIEEAPPSWYHHKSGVKSSKRKNRCDKKFTLKYDVRIATETTNACRPNRLLPSSCTLLKPAIINGIITSSPSILHHCRAEDFPYTNPSATPHISNTVGLSRITEYYPPTIASSV